MMSNPCIPGISHFFPQRAFDFWEVASRLETVLTSINMTFADSVWNSGETCEVVGKYSSRCCAGELESRFVAGDIFPNCHQCSAKLKWRRSLAESLPVDTIETGAKSGVKKGKKIDSTLRKRAG